MNLEMMARNSHLIFIFLYFYFVYETLIYAKFASSNYYQEDPFEPNASQHPPVPEEKYTS